MTATNPKEIIPKVPSKSLEKSDKLLTSKDKSYNQAIRMKIIPQCKLELLPGLNSADSADIMFREKKIKKKTQKFSPDKIIQTTSKQICGKA